MLVWIVFSTITYFVPLRQVGRAKRSGWINLSPFRFHLYSLKPPENYIQQRTFIGSNLWVKVMNFIILFFIIAEKAYLCNVLHSRYEVDDKRYRTLHNIKASSMLCQLAV